MNTKKEFDLFKKALKTKDENLFNDLMSKVDLTSPINQQGDYPIIAAFKQKKSHLANKLVEKGASLNVVDENGQTPLMYLSQDAKYHSSMLKNWLELIIDLNIQDRLGNTALMHAVKNKDMRMIKLL